MVTAYQGLDSMFICNCAEDFVHNLRNPWLPSLPFHGPVKGKFKVI